MDFLNMNQQNKQPFNTVQYQYRSWLTDSETETLVGNMGDNLTTSSPKNLENIPQTIKQDKIIITQLNPRLDATASDYDSEPRCKQFRLSMWRIDRIQQTKIIVAQQLVTIWNPDVSVFMSKLFFSVDGNYLFFLLKRKSDDCFLKVLAFESLSLKQVNGLSFGQETLKSVTGMRDIMIDPVMFKLSQDYVQANGADLHDEAKVQEEEELFKRKKVKEPNPDEALKDIHYAMYFQDRKRGYFIFNDPSQNIEMNLRIEGTSLIQNSDSGYNASYDNNSQFASPKQSMQSNKRVGQPDNTSIEQLQIVNFFFGMSESDDSAIIFSKFIDNVKEASTGKQNILKTQVITMTKFFQELRKSPKNKFNPIDKTHGVLRTTDYWVPKDFYVDHQTLIIESSFYHKRHGIFIRTFGEIDETKALEDFGNQFRQQLILYIPQNVLTKNSPDFQMRYFGMEDFRLPLNPSLHSNLCFKEKVNKLDYLILVDDMIMNKGSVESVIFNKRALEISNFRAVPKAYDDKLDREKYMDFIVTLGQKNSMSVADVDIESSQVHLKRPFIVFYDNEDEGFQTAQYQSVHPTIKIEKQAVQFNEPYIVTVEDQITLNVYSTVFPDRNYILNLQNHFEFFLDIPAGDVLINKVRYFRHQVCMMVTYDLANRCHRVECLILPSFKDMVGTEDQNQLINDQSFKIITLNYKIKINLGVPQPFTVLKDKVVSAQFLQFRQPTKFTTSMLDMLYDSSRRQDTLLLQLKDSVMMYDLQNKTQFENEVQTNQGKIKILKTHGFALLRDYNTNELTKQGRENEAELSNTLGDPQFYFVYQRASRFDLQAQSKIILFRVNCQNQYRSEVIHEFPKQTVTKKMQENGANGGTDDDFNDDILQISLAEDDPEGTTILVLDKNFVVQKLKLTVKTNDLEVNVIDESLPIEQAAKLWLNVKENFLRQRIIMPENSIVINDHGIILDNNYFQYFSKNNPGREKESMLDFELQRSKLISFKFARTRADQIKMNYSGPLSSPDQMSVMMQFTRYTAPTVEATAASAILSKYSNVGAAARKSIVSREDGDIVVQQHHDPTQPESHSFFLSLPHMASKITNLIPIDTFALEDIEYSSFLGTEADDVLVKIKDRFLIFDSAGRLSQLQAAMIPQGFDMGEYKVKEMLLCQRPQKNTGKQQAQIDIENRTSMQIDDDFWFRILMTNKKKNHYAVLSITRRLNSLRNYVLTVDACNQDIIPVGFAQKNSSVAWHIKFSPNGEVIKFLLNKTTPRPLRAPSVNVTGLSARELDDYALVNNSIHFYINGIRNLQIENKMRLTINAEIFAELKQEALEAEKQAAAEQEQMRLSKKATGQLANIVNNEMGELLLDGNRDAYAQQEISIDDEENFLPIKTSLVQGQELQFIDHDFDHLFLQRETDGCQYFVFKSRTNLYYEKINLSNAINANNDNEQLTKFDMKLSQPGSIYQILPVKSKQHVQFLYHDKVTKNYHMFVWNLGVTCTNSTNQEEQMQTFRPTTQSPFSILIKGSKLRENYLFFQGTDSYMDLRLDFPLNFLSGKRAWSPLFNPAHFNFEPAKKAAIVDYYNNIHKVYEKYVNEMKICSEGSHCLGLYGLALAQIQRSYCFIDLQYMRYLNKKFLNDKTLKEGSQKSLLLENMSVMLPNQCNLLQYFALNQSFLQLYLKEILEKLEEAVDIRQAQQVLNFAYYPLCPNSLPMIQTQGKGRRPFSLALKSNQAACFELLLQILMTDPQRNYIMHIKTYLTQLMLWRGEIVQNFLLTRCQKYLFSKKVPSAQGRVKFGFLKSCRQQNPETENYNESVTQYINNKEKFTHLCGDEETLRMEAIQKKIKERKMRFDAAKVEKRIHQEYDDPISDDEQEQRTIKEYQIVLKNKKQKQLAGSEKTLNQRAVHFYAFDFQHQLLGKKAEMLLRFLTNQSNNLRVFELKHIQTLLEYQWRNINIEYYCILAVYIFKILFMMIYVVIDDRLINCTSSSDSNVETEHQCSYGIVYKINIMGSNVDETVFILQLILFLTQIFLTHYELKRYLQVPTMSSMVVFIFNIINLVKLGTDKYFLTLFQDIVYDYNLQADLTIDYTTKIDRRYQDRYAMFYIQTIRAGNAFMLITLPLIFFYKIRFLPFVNLYVPRFFLALSAIFPLTMIFMVLYAFLTYAQGILGDMRYGLGNTEKDFVTTPYESLFGLIRVLDYVNLMYRSIFGLIITTISVMFFQYIGASMSKADSKATKDLQLQRFMNLAKLMIENSFLINKEKKYHDARYVIVSHKEKSKTITNSSAEADMADADQDQSNSAEPGSAVIQNKDLGAASTQQIKEMLASERIKTEHSLQEIKSMIAQFEKHNQSAVKDIQSSLAQMESAAGPM